MTTDHAAAVEAPPEALMRVLAPPEDRLWEMVSQAEDGFAYRHRLRPLTLIWSVARESDGNWWQHLSVGSMIRLPTWDEFVAAKEWLMGDDTYAYQVCPPRQFYVNQNPNVLHWFRRVGDGSPYHPVDDGRSLPEFSHGGGTL